MRGTLFRNRNNTIRHGIIPAYAGNTHRNGVRARTCGDHPRVCGEHTSCICSSSSLRGSSPRMRGTLMLAVSVAVVLGIIPAYAGNTSCTVIVYNFPWDHPRVCGEHDPPIRVGTRRQGSSPRMRGTRRLRAFLRKSRRIIPAYAGNTIRCLSARRAIVDHPRVCGEHVQASALGQLTSGSSPRMRGTRVRHVGGDAVSGIIPAYAGNTAVETCAYPFNRDHPRVCGEHAICPRSKFVKTGSSPRMRGTLVSSKYDGGAHGIIPAYAGNTHTPEYR